MAAVFSRGDMIRIGVVLFVTFVSISVPTMDLAQTSAPPSPGTTSLPCMDGGPGCINIGFTDAWFNGGTVRLEYSHRCFGAQPPGSAASPDCEAGKASPTKPPRGPGAVNVYAFYPSA